MKMKSTIISMLIILIVMVAVPMVMFGEGDLAKKLGFGGDLMKDLRAKAPKNIKPAVTDKRVEVYKWVDEHGVTQFSNTPPPENGASEKIILTPDINVMNAVKIPEKESQTASGPQIFQVGNPYSPGGMKDVVDSAKDVQEMVDQRKVDQDKMMKDMFK